MAAAGSLSGPGEGPPADRPVLAAAQVHLELARLGEAAHRDELGAAEGPDVSAGLGAGGARVVDDDGAAPGEVGGGESGDHVVAMAGTTTASTTDPVRSTVTTWGTPRTNASRVDAGSPSGSIRLRRRAVAARPWRASSSAGGSAVAGSATQRCPGSAASAVSAAAGVGPGGEALVPEVGVVDRDREGVESVGERRWCGARCRGSTGRARVRRRREPRSAPSPARSPHPPR